jgi:GNAT superfamily N-acetyltransferase
MRPILPASYGAPVGDWTIRPMRSDDVPAAERLSDEAFYQLDVATYPPDWHPPARRTADHSAGWQRRTQHFLDTDPGGCWVAEDESGMVGFATSIRRELMWCLATYAVRPGLQGSGIGRQLLEAAIEHGRGCLRGMLSASSDPKAARRYRAAGFDLHPQMFMRGEVDRSVIPVVDKVREGTASDVELMDSLDRRTRGAAHGPDHRLLLSSFRLLVSDTSTGSGYAYMSPGQLQLLAASNRRTAQRLLWAVLADSHGETVVPHLTAANHWAIDVGMAARLDLRQSGYLALRGMKPPSPYVHNGALL